MSPIPNAKPSCDVSARASIGGGGRLAVAWPSALAGAVPGTLLLCGVAVALFALSVSQPLHRDENQFIAAGALLARRGLLPYRDYPYFHMPNLVFVYALLFQMSGHLLFAARSFSVGCALVMVTFVFVYTGRLFHDRRLTTRFVMSAGAVAVLLAHPAFLIACGKAWNHDVPLLLAVLAFAAFCRGLRGPGRRPKWAWLVTAGLLIGTAVGTRLTFAPAACALAVAALGLPPYPLRQRVQALGAVFAGATAGLLPAVVLLLLAPGHFVFGNLRFPQLTAAYWSGLDAHPLTAWYVIHQKASMVIEYSSAGGTGIVLLGATLVAAWAGRRRTPVLQTERTVLGLLTLFLWVGAVIPTPSRPQYFYDPIPFLVLLLACHVCRACEGRRLSWAVVLPVILVAAALGGRPYAHALRCLPHTSWQSLAIHEVSQRAARAVGGRGYVLTLEPVLALEGGMDIYPPYATGMFAMRLTPQLPPPEAWDLGFDAEGLPAGLTIAPPAAVLTCGDTALYDAPLVEYARRRGWKQTEIGKAGEVLWAPP